MRFWDISKNLVSVRYLTSEYLGHTAVTDLFPRIKRIVSSLNDCTLIQFGMDGPKVNEALYRKIVADRSNDGLNELIDLGTYCLHIIIIEGR